MAGVNVASQIRKNHIFMVNGDFVPYWIAADATYNGADTLFNLTGNYQGASRVAAPGIVVVDATLPDNIPTISQGDVGTATVFTAAMYRIQELITALDNGGTTDPGGGGTGPASTDQLAEGTTNLYFTAARVRGTLLTGLVAGTATVIAATDTVLQALQKLQSQLTAHVGQGGTAHAVATTTNAGFMSAADKSKLDGIPAGGGSGGGGPTTSFGPTPPSSPIHLQEWIDSNTMTRFTYINDGNSSQWVNV